MMEHDPVSLVHLLVLGTPLLVVLLAIIIVYLNNQSWKKMDRLAALLYAEKEIIYNKIDSLMIKIGELTGIISEMKKGK